VFYSFLAKQNQRDCFSWIGLGWMGMGLKHFIGEYFLGVVVFYFLVVGLWFGEYLLLICGFDVGWLIWEG